MAGGGEVDSEEAAVTMEDMTETIATRHLTNSSWKESGRLVVVAHLRLDMARWNMSREVVSLSMSDMVVVITSVFSAPATNARPSSQE